MARQSVTTYGHTASGPAVLGLAIVGVAAGVQEKAATVLCHLVCAVGGELLQALPGILLSALQAMECFALDHSPVFGCVQLLMWAGPLLHFLVGVV